MKNKYKIMGNKTIIYARCNNKLTHEVLIDTEDLELVKWITGSWVVNSDGYVVGSFYGRPLYLHRLVMKQLNAIYQEIDHINHNKLDNRKSQLRIVTRSENQQNRRINKNNNSGVTGVYYDPEAKKWIARITTNNKRIHLGIFDNKDDAIEARKHGEKKYHKYKQSIEHLQNT